MKWKEWELELLAKQDDYEGDYQPLPMRSVGKLFWAGYLLIFLPGLIYGLWRLTR